MLVVKTIAFSNFSAVIFVLSETETGIRNNPVIIIIIIIMYSNIIIIMIVNLFVQ